MILTDQDFEKEINSSKIPVLVDFFATWCEPCQVLGPLLEKIEKEMEGKFVLAKVNVESAPIASQKFGVERIPTVILFKDGKAVNGFIGLAGEEDIKKWLNEFLK